MFHLNIYESATEVAAAIQKHLDSGTAARMLCCYQGGLAELYALSTIVLADYLYVGEDDYSFDDRCATIKVGGLLGREYERVIVDARSGVSARALGVCGGLVAKGGVLLLCLPSTERMSVLTEEVKRFAIIAGDFTQSLFERRLFELISNYIPLFRPAVINFEKDQSLVVKSIVSAASGRAKRPLVLTADRGRGKSYALGLAIVELLQLRPKLNIALTAMRRTALDAVYLAMALHHIDASRVRYLPVDVVVAESIAEVDVLFVDEAAAIPVPQLAYIAERYTRVIFSSTTHGYEGSGRGFTQRFFKVLDKLRPQWRRLTMTAPIRWAHGDPLEAFISDALLLGAEPHDREVIGLIDSSRLLFKELSAEQLTTDETLLTQFFGLLVGAHYQTTPDDLRMLLDSTAIRRFALFAGDSIVAVCLLAVEGGGSAAIDCEQVWQGRRRTRGQLAVQQLIASYRLYEAASLRSYRVMRIAVHYDYQGQGIGQQLLAAVENQARLNSVDFVSSVFGVNDELISFWQSAGYQSVKLGFKRDNASGEHSVIVLRCLTREGNVLLKEAREQFLRALPHWLTEPFRFLAPELVARLLYVGEAEQLDAYIVDSAKAYAQASNSYDNCSPALYSLALHAFVIGVDLPEVAVRILALKLMQRRSWNDVVSVLGCCGQKGAEAELKAAICLCLDAVATDNIGED